MVKSLKIAVLLCGLIPMTAGARQQGQTNNPVHFVGNYLEVTAIGNPPDNNRGPAGYPQARRAAEVLAYRSIAEQIAGVQINSDTDIRGLGTEQADRVTAAVRSRIQACTITDDEDALRRGYAANGYVTVRCRVSLTGSGGVLSPVIDTIEPEMKKKLDEQKLPAYTPPPAPPSAPAAAGVADYDGLIIKVPAAFKPSLFPKVRTEKGEVVYSLKDVSLEIQKNRGLATYTDDAGKATSSLRAMGAQSILTIDGSLFLDTEAQIKSEDAAKVANANKKTSFLNSARVVFVIGKSS